MITLGMTNSIFSVLVGHVARHVAREAIVGVGTILHLGLMVFLLVWIPDPHLFAVFFVISALWGVCDAIWQTQCNCKFGLSFHLITKLVVYGIWQMQCNCNLVQDAI